MRATADSLYSILGKPRAALAVSETFNCKGRQCVRTDTAGPALVAKGARNSTGSGFNLLPLSRWIYRKTGIETASYFPLSASPQDLGTLNVFHALPPEGLQKDAALEFRHKCARVFASVRMPFPHKSLYQPKRPSEIVDK